MQVDEEDEGGRRQRIKEEVKAPVNLIASKG